MIKMELNAIMDCIQETVNKKTAQNETLSNSFMYQDFLNSGISKETIDKYVKGGYLSETDEYWQLHYPALYANYRTDYYSRRLKKVSNSGGKYRKPKGQTTRIFRPIDLPISVLKDPNMYIILTEGDKKAIKATQEGFNCISISGVWNWKKKL